MINVRMAEAHGAQDRGQLNQVACSGMAAAPDRLHWCGQHGGGVFSTALARPAGRSARRSSALLNGIAFSR